MLVLDADPVNDAPILDLRLRKGMRRRGLKLAVASPGASLARPQRRAVAPLRARARRGLRGRAGRGARAAARSSSASRGERAPRPGRSASWPSCCAGAAEDAERCAETREVVILWGERLTAGPNGEAGASALLEIANRLGLAGTEGAGLLEIPSAANGRGLREAGVLPNAGPGLSEPDSRVRHATRGDR